MKKKPKDKPKAKGIGSAKKFAAFAKGRVGGPAFKKKGAKRAA